MQVIDKELHIDMEGVIGLKMTLFPFYTSLYYSFSYAFIQKVFLSHCNVSGTVLRVVAIMMSKTVRFSALIKFSF